MLTHVRFEAPGAGPWEREGAHFPRPVTRFAREGLLRAFPKGFAEGAERYGLLLSHFKVAAVNGFWYQQPVAFGAPEGAAGPPPAPVLWLLTRLHPKLRARIERSRVAFEQRLWREDLARWDAVDRPRAIEQHEALQAIDPGALSTEALADLLAEARAHAEAMILLHHRYTIPCCIPIGDYLAHVVEWTGASAGEALELLRGTSPISNGFAAAELTALAEAIRASDAARGCLAQGGGAATLLDALCALEDDVGPAARAYLERVRFRSLGYDLSDETAGELPDMLVRAVKAAVDARDASGVLADREAKERALRARVPETHRASFDALLAEARAVNRLRDERGAYSDGWGTGLARRVVLEAGRRLVAAGKLSRADHAVDLTADELASLLRGGPGPSAEEVEAHVLWRTTKTVEDAPAFLNAPPAPPPAPELLPAPARRAARAVDAVLSNLFKEPEARASAERVRGLSVNAGIYEGTARVVAGAADFGKLEQGDVLVTVATSPYFNVVLPLLGALVTDRGGQLCHAAIVAREYGIPGIVGTKEATRIIPDGARVRVDGTTGEVTVLSRPS